MPQSLASVHQVFVYINLFAQYTSKMCFVPIGDIQIFGSFFRPPNLRFTFALKHCLGR